MTPLTSRPGGPVDQPVNQVAKRLSIKPEQVLLAWSRAKGCVFYYLENSYDTMQGADQIAIRAIPVTTSSKKERLEGYLDVGDITLTEDDIRAIDKAGAKGELWFDRKARFGKVLTRAVFLMALFWLFRTCCH